MTNIPIPTTVAETRTVGNIQEEDDGEEGLVTAEVEEEVEEEEGDARLDDAFVVLAVNAAGAVPAVGVGGGLGMRAGEG